MIEIEFSKRGILRIWIDEVPPVERLSSEFSWLRQCFGGSKLKAFHKCAAVEIYQPFGATFHYGLLGVELQESTSDELIVSVPMDTPDPKIPYVSSLAARVDEVVVGSTPEYAEAVLKSLRNFSSELLPGGQLSFTYMAHGAVGSAQIVFEKLTAAAVRLLLMGEPPLEEGEVLALLEGA